MLCGVKGKLVGTFNKKKALEYCENFMTALQIMNGLLSPAGEASTHPLHGLVFHWRIKN